MLSGSQFDFGNYPSNDIAAGDLNSDGTAEQIAAWLDSDSTINLSIGEMPGSPARLTSAPAAVVRTPAPYGSALSFDGADDYVRVTNAPSLNPALITIGVWAKSNTPNWTGSGFLVSKRNAYIMHPIMGTRNIELEVYIGGWKYASFTAPDSFDITAWHHYAGTYDGPLMHVCTSMVSS